MDFANVGHYFQEVWAVLTRNRHPWCQADTHNPHGNPTMSACPHRSAETIAHRASPTTWLVLDVCEQHARELASGKPSD